MGTFFHTCFRVNLAAVLMAAALTSCHKPDLCQIGTFSATQCVDGRVDIVTRRLNEVPIDGATCEEMRDRILAEMEASGNAYFWYGHEIQPEDLVYCKCK